MGKFNKADEPPTATHWTESVLKQLKDKMFGTQP